MGLVAILTMIVVIFAMVVGAAIGMVCGEMFGDLYDDDIAGACEWDGEADGAPSWFGGALDAILKYTGASSLAALPATTSAASDSPLERLAVRLFGAPSGIDWEAANLSEPSVELVKRLYELYSNKQQSAGESNHDMAACSCDTKVATKSGFIVDRLRAAGAITNNAGDTSAISDLLTPTIVYADIGAGDCTLTLAIAKALHASKIYNIDVVNYCPNMAEVNYIDGAIDKTIDIPDNSVDVITVINALHHIVDYKHKIAEAKRILKPNGILLIQDNIVSSSRDEDIAEAKRDIELQHCLYMISNQAARDVLLDYEEFKKLITTYATELSIVLFSREGLDKLLLGQSQGVSALSMLSFDMRQGINHDNTFVAVYKK